MNSADLPLATQPGVLRRALRFLGWTVVGVYFGFAVIVLGVRYWVLPDIGSYSGTIEQAVSNALGEKVSIGRINARWQGLHPELDLVDVVVFDRDGREALRLPAVETVIGWRSLLYGSVRLHSLAIEQPDLEIRRDAAGRIFVAGIELKNDTSGPDFSDWLFAQSEISVRNARITWVDEKRSAPPLTLSGLSLLLRNNGDSHRFAIKAQAARELASTLDIRGELTGESIDRPLDWRGRLFAELDYVDLAAWQRWVDYPVEVGSGQGGLRMWLGFDRGRVNEITADLALAGVRGRVQKALPELDLESLYGRLGYRDGERAIDIFGRKLALKSTGGVALPEADVTLRLERAAAKPGVPVEPGALPAIARGELQADALEVAPLVQLAEFLPFEAQLRKALADRQPVGKVNDLKISWVAATDGTGAIERYNVRGKFSRFAVRAREGAPGFGGLSGTVDAKESGGTVALAGEKATIDLAGLLPENPLRLDTFAAQVAWTLAKDHTVIRVSGGQIANRDLAGSFSGSWTDKGAHAEGSGVVDINASFNRADARAIARYIPRMGKATQEFLRNAVQSGTASDVKLRIRGDLHDFPYANAKLGNFNVQGRLSNVDFQFAEAWPKLAGATGEFVFDGPRLTVTANRASIFGVRVASIKATVPDLYHGDEQLALDGQIEGSITEMLRFVEASPVTRYIDGATLNFVASGPARLGLRLDLPLERLDKTRVSGNLQLINNQVTVDPEVPPLSQVNGRLEFTETGLVARNMSAQFLGGPASFSVSTRSEGAVTPASPMAATVSAQGTASALSVGKLLDLPLLDRASGASAWRATAVLRKQSMDLVVDSTLQGIAFALPAPLAKVAADAMPLRLERSTAPDGELARRLQVRLPARGEVMAVSIGKTVNAVTVRRREGDRMLIERAAVGLNEPAPAANRSGIVVTGTLATLDVDRWRSLLPASGDSVSVASLNLSAGVLDVLGKRFHDVRLRASNTNGGWGATVGARELAGTINWRPEGKGRVTARLKHFIVPEESPDRAQVDSNTSSDLPALDVVAESFATRERKYGKMELAATNDGRDWRIERLSLGLGEGTLTADGVWQSWASRPSISLNIGLDVSDAGGFLTQFGYPGTLKGGTAKLEGKLGWVGSPQTIDYPTLTGTLALSAQKGQFLKAEPGIAKLLGVLSLQSWITLDFREMFSEGFAFDALSGHASITKGVMNTEDFTMKGKAAQVSMSGQIDLAHETQKLKVRVVPSIGDSFSSVAGLVLANPIAGLGAMLAQRLFKDPLGQVFAYEYTVTGTWADPKADPVVREVPAGSAPATFPPPPPAAAPAK